ncbi:MAG: DbpA RNA binding domain-containing protein, partial [Victivallales bacterium]
QHRTSSREVYVGPMIKLRINVGKLNGLSVPALISMINRATHGPMIKLGRIRLMEQFSVFEIAAGNEQKLMQNLSKVNFEDRQLKCVMETGDSRGAGPQDAAPRNAGSRDAAAPHPHHEKREYHGKPEHHGKPESHGPKEHFKKKKPFYSQVHAKD